AYAQGSLELHHRRRAHHDFRDGLFCAHGPVLEIRHRPDIRLLIMMMTEEVRRAESAMSKKWYVIQTYSGYENKVKEALLLRIKEHNKEASFGEILIPTETVQETRTNGKQRIRQKTSLPGYIFVEMDMSEEAWHLVKD